MKYGKVWGTTELLFKHNGVEVHRIFIKKGFACSKHKHNMRSNAFYVEQGDLVIQVWKNDYRLIDSTRLLNGQRTGVPAGEYHSFFALKNTVALEWYWIENMNKDISRKDHGRKLTKKEIDDFKKMI